MTTIWRMSFSLPLCERSPELETEVVVIDCEWPAGAVSAQIAVNNSVEYKSFERFIYISLN